MSETSLAAGSWQALTFVVCPTSGGAALAIVTAIAVSSSWKSSILKNTANKGRILKSSRVGGSARSLAREHAQTVKRARQCSHVPQAPYWESLRWHA